MSNDDPVNPMHFVGSRSTSLGQQNSMSNMKSNICRKKTITHNFAQDDLKGILEQEQCLDYWLSHNPKLQGNL